VSVLWYPECAVCESAHWDSDHSVRRQADRLLELFYPDKGSPAAGAPLVLHQRHLSEIG